MTIPTYDKFIDPILRILASNPEGIAAREVHDAAASALGISDVERQTPLSSGTQLIYKNRAGWAHDRLKRAGLSNSPRRGLWKLTETGLNYAAGHPGALTEIEIAEIAFGYTDVRLKPPPIGASPVASSLVESMALSEVTSASPDERLGDAITEMRRSVAAELLEALAEVSPMYFEAIVLDLLHRMGYGASRADLEQVGGSGDGGIDGVISLDKLGLEKVYVQAKRMSKLNDGKALSGGRRSRAFMARLRGGAPTMGCSSQLLPTRLRRLNLQSPLTDLC